MARVRQDDATTAEVVLFHVERHPYRVATIARAATKLGVTSGDRLVGSGNKRAAVERWLRSQM